MKKVKFSDHTMESEDHHHDSHEIELGGEPMSKMERTRSSMPNTFATDAGDGGGSGIISRQQDERDHNVITLQIPDGSMPLPSIKEAAGNDLGEDDKQTLPETRTGRKKLFVASVVKATIQMKRLATFSKHAPPAASTEAHNVDRTNAAATRALEGLKFINDKTSADDAGWPEVEKQFGKLSAYHNGNLPRSFYAKCIGMEKELAPFAEKLFEAIAKRLNIQGDSINKPQLKRIWNQISDPSFDSRLRTFFDMANNHADRRITKEEIEQVFYHSAAAKKLSDIQEKAGEYATLIMEVLDTEGTGSTTLEKLEKALFQVTTDSTRGDSKDLGWYKKTKYFLQENWKRIWVLALWICVMAGLFAYKFIQYRRKAAHEVMGNCVCMAKGAAETLKLNMAIILLPVCRNTITWIRTKTKLGIIVPLDDNINFHKVIALAIAIGVLLHATSHLACDFPRLLHASSYKYKLMEPFFGPQPSNYWHFVKSWEGVTGIVMVVLMAIAFTLASPSFRRKRIKLPKLFNKLTGFNAFWYSHHLFVFVYASLIVHGIKLYLTKEWYKKTTWMYLAIPITIYLLERLIRALRSSIKHVTVKRVTFYTGDVLALRMSKPERFTYKSGQYMFVKCADVSPFEWHPFSITSAPGEDELSVHIKRAGDWTGSLIDKFTKLCHQSTAGKSGVLRAERLQGDSNPILFPEVVIDGPYGAPAQEYRQYEVVLLVGSGIGATPMISILKDIVRNYKAMEAEKEESIEEGGASGKSQHKKKSKFKTKRVYFYWVAPKQGLFDCFKGVMKEVAEEDHRGVIELHTHFTRAYERGDDPSALNAMLQSLFYAKHGVDTVTGTRVMPHFGRPKWGSVYERIAQDYQRLLPKKEKDDAHDQQQARVGVFYCGGPEAAGELRQLALDFSRNKAIGIKFDFHKENF